MGKPILESDIPADNEALTFVDANDDWEAVAGGGGGQSNTSSNSGTGDGWALAKSGVDLPFKSLIGEINKVIVTSNAADLTITIGTDVVTLTASQTLTNKTLTNPTFTDPVLGQPDSGDLTNCTVIPMAQASGILPDANMPDLTGDVTTVEGAVATTIGAAKVLLSMIATAAKTEVFVIAISDETTAITTGTAKVTFRMPYGFTVTDVRASLSTASSSGLPTFDINEGGTSILSTKITIDQDETTSETAVTAPVISDSALADDAEMTLDIDVAGTGAKGAKIYIIGYQT